MSAVIVPSPNLDRICTPVCPSDTQLLEIPDLDETTLVVEGWPTKQKQEAMKYSSDKRLWIATDDYGGDDETKALCTPPPTSHPLGVL